MRSIDKQGQFHAKGLELGNCGDAHQVMMKAKIRNSQVCIDCGDALQREEAGVI